MYTDCIYMYYASLVSVTIIITKYSRLVPLSSLQMAMQLMEKNVHEKQDNIVSLRRQLQEMKTANLKMSTQIKVGLPSPLFVGGNTVNITCNEHTYSQFLMI